MLKHASPKIQTNRFAADGIIVICWSKYWKNKIISKYKDTSLWYQNFNIKRSKIIIL